MQQRQEEEKQRRRQAQQERRARREQQETEKTETTQAPVSRARPIVLLAGLVLAVAMIVVGFLMKQNTVQDASVQNPVETAGVVTEPAVETLPTLTADDFLAEVGASACELAGSHYNGHGSDAFTYHARNNGNVLVVESENLYVTITDGKEVSATVSGLDIQDAYLVNQKDSFYSVQEYGWHLYFFGEDDYSVGTSCYAFDPGNTEELTIGQMQKTLWQVDGITSHYTENPVSVAWTSDSITWTYTVPEEYPFDFTKLEQMALHVSNIPDEVHFCRVYNPMPEGSEKEERFAYMPAQDPSYAPDAWKSNVMSSFTQGHNAFIKTMIRRVIFLDTVQDAPDVNWDVSATEDGSVLMWLDRKPSGTDMYIAAEGGINAGEFCLGLFEGYTHLEEIYFNGHFHTDNVCRMDKMFKDCNRLTEVDLSSLNTEKLSIMSYMFAGCNALRNLNFSNWDTSNVTDMEAVFWGCSMLEKLDLSSFDTANVIYMDWMFRDCSSLKNLNLSNFDTARVQQMNRMFEGCASLTELDISEWNISNVKTYFDFMDEGKTINGRPWEEFFQ